MMFLIKKIKIYLIETIHWCLYFENNHEFPIFYYIDFLIYVYKICLSRYKELKSSTGAVQPLNDALHIK